jgi:hypothetical protein
MGLLYIFCLLLRTAERMAVKNHIAVVWVMAPGCSLAGGYRSHIFHLLLCSFLRSNPDINFFTYFTV